MKISNPATIIVNWNLKDDTLECIDSLLSAGLNPEDIILIDNGSSDGSVLEFEHRYANRLHLIKNQSNLGYARAVNLGLNHALSTDREWIFLLNNDTIVAPDIFQVFSATLQKRPGYLIQSPMIFFHEDPNRIWFAGSQLIPGTLLTRDKLRNQEYNPGFPETYPIDFVNGCGMLVNKQVFKKIGLFDSSLIMYGEEVDFCWRARLAGYKMATSTKAHMWHKISLSAKRDMPRTRFLKIRNQIYFYRKYSYGLQLFAHFLYSSFRCIYLMFKDILSSQTQLIKPLFQAWYSGWFVSMDQENSVHENI